MGESALEEVYRNALGNKFSRLLVGPRERANYIPYRRVRDLIGGYCPLGRRATLGLMAAIPALGLGGLELTKSNPDSTDKFDASKALAGSALGGASTLSLSTLGLKAFDNLEERRLLKNLEKQVKTKDLSASQLEDYIYLKRRQLGYMDNDIDADVKGAAQRVNNANRYNKLSTKLQNILFGKTDKPNTLGKLLNYSNSKLPSTFKKHLKNLNLRSKVTPISLATALASVIGLSNGFNFTKEASAKQKEKTDNFSPLGTTLGSIGSASLLVASNDVLTDYLPKFLLVNTDPRDKKFRTLKNILHSKTGVPGVVGNIIDHLNDNIDRRSIDKYLKKNPNATYSDAVKLTTDGNIRNNIVKRVTDFLVKDPSKMVEVLVDNPNYVEGSNVAKQIKKLVPVDERISMVQKYFNPKYMNKKTKWLYLSGVLGALLGGTKLA